MFISWSKCFENEGRIQIHDLLITRHSLTTKPLGLCGEQECTMILSLLNQTDFKISGHLVLTGQTVLNMNYFLAYLCPGVEHQQEGPDGLSHAAYHPDRTTTTPPSHPLHKPGSGNQECFWMHTAWKNRNVHLRHCLVIRIPICSIKHA